MREKAPGRWELRVYAGQSDGKKRWVSRVHRGGARSAAKALSVLETEVACGAVKRAAPVVTVAELLEQHIESRREGWSPNTLRNRRRLVDIEIVPVMGNRNVRSVTPREVENLTRDIAESRPPTARAVLAVLRVAFSDAQRWEMVDRNPAQVAKPPTVPERAMVAPTKEQLRAVMHAASRPDDDGVVHLAMPTLIRTAIATGCRRGELAALRWSDLDLDDGVVIVSRSIVSVDRRPVEKPTKTGAIKVLPIGPGTVAALKSWRVDRIEAALELGVPWREDGYVWSRRPDGRDPWGLGSITHRWRALADSAGLSGIRFHDLRHAMVTELLGAGFDVTVVADRAGHSSRSVTIDTYGHALPARSRDAGDHMDHVLDG